MYKPIPANSFSKLMILSLFLILPFVGISAQIVIDTVLFNPCIPAGSSNIPVTVNASGGSSSLYQVSTNNGASYGTFGVYTSNLNIGNSYNIIVRDSSNALSDTVLITIPTALNATINLQFNYNGAAISCFKASDGSAEAIAGGGTGPYTYAWNSFPPQSTALATGLGEGTYIVTITDANNCVALDTVIINEPAPILLTSSVTNVTCNAAANGTATVTPTGGTGTLGYIWNTTPGQTANTATGLAPGVYSVTATDANGCGKIESVTITEPSTITLTAATNTNPSCNSASDGTANSSISGGNSPYTFIWTGGQTTQNATGLSNGIYTVTATDANGCENTATVTLTEPNAVTITTALGANALCNNSSDGSATATASGGTGSGYTYIWSTTPTQTAATATGLAAGAYNVTSSDSNGCTATNSITITEPSDITVTTSVSSNYNGAQISCNGASDGTGLAAANGGSPGYSFVWNTSPAQSSATVTGLSAGIYTVTTTDLNGCAKTTNLTITEPSAITATTAVTVPIACNGNATASAQATANGGLGAPYNFVWNTTPAQSAQTATGLAAGIYTVTVTDINNCPQTSTITITEPSAVSISAAVTSNYNGAQVSCNGANDGTAMATPTGGTAAYSYTWSTAPVQNTASATGLAAGTYQVTVTDANGCTISTSITVTEPAAVTLTAAVTSNYNGAEVSCNGASDGTAMATPTGGTPTFSYNWSTAPAQTAQTATGLSAGTYSVTATDLNGCNQIQSVTLTEPSAITLTAAVTSNYNGVPLSCNGASDGTGLATANGGTGALAYVWSTTPAQSTATATGLSAGVYTVTSTDLNGCNRTQSITLTEPSAITATTAVTVPIACNGNATASAQATANGGLGAPYNFVWNTTPAQSAQTATGLAAGIYTVTVTDINNCPQTSTITITEPSAVSISAAVTSNYNGAQVSCNGANDGTAMATPTGGTAAYSYTWSTAPTQNTQTASALSAGPYQVTVTDANGCTISTSITITEPAAVTLTAAVTSNYNGAEVSCNGASDGTAMATPTGGTPTFSYNWSTAPTQTAQTATGLAAGTYSVTATDLNGCNQIQSVTLTEPSAITLTAAVTSNYNGVPLSCNGSNDGTGLATANGGTGALAYVWNTTPAQSTATATGLSAGVYTVTSTDLNGCNRTQSITLTEPSAITATTAVTVPIACNGNATASAQATANGGLGAPYNFVWNTTPAQSTQSATGLAAGTYTVTVTDNNNCQQTSTITITEPSAVTATTAVSSSYNGADITCSGASNGAIQVVGTGGTAGYSYIWSTNPTQTTQTATGLTAGTYSVTLSDANGCTTTQTQLITEPALLLATTSTTPAFCSNFNGTATATPSGGTAPYLYAWSTGGTTATINQLDTGIYNLVVTDINGCSFNISDTVLATSYLISTTSIVDSSDCYAPNSGTIDVSVQNAVYPLTYNWSNTATDSSLTNLADGTYYVTVTDVNSCSTIDSFVIFSPEDTLTISLSSPTYANGFNTTKTDVADGSIDATISGGVLPYTLIWSNGSTEEDLTAIQAAIYTITVTDVNGCVKTATIELTEPEPEPPMMPEGISPDEDNLNDAFVVLNIEYYPENVLTIYNRWGSEVNRYEGYANEWTGLNKNGEELPAGTYYVILQLTDREQFYKGYVEIRRR